MKPVSYISYTELVCASSRYTDKRADATGKGYVLDLLAPAQATVADGKTSHNLVTVPPGQYDVVKLGVLEQWEGSDYCWYLVTYYAIIRSVKRPDLTYRVPYSFGGDHIKDPVGTILEPDSAPVNGSFNAAPEPLPFGVHNRI